MSLQLNKILTATLKDFGPLPNPKASRFQYLLQFIPMILLLIRLLIFLHVCRISFYKVYKQPFFDILHNMQSVQNTVFNTINLEYSQIVKCLNDTNDEKSMWT